MFIKTYNDVFDCGVELSDWDKENKTISYYTLAKVVGDMIMCNGITDLFEDYDFELWHGNSYDEEDEYYKEIFQYYIISEHGAKILQKYTDEIVYYNEELDMYIWGITHIGTSWSIVPTDIEFENTDDFEEWYEWCKEQNEF